MVLRDIIFLTMIASAVHAENVSYENYKVYKTVPKSDHEVQVLIDLEKNSEYMFWSDIIDVNSDIRIMVAPEKQLEFENYLVNVNISSTVVIDNVQESINSQLQRPASRNTNYDWTYYLSLDEINAWLDQIAADHPDVVTLVDMGVSTGEGRKIRGVIIDYKKEENPLIGMIEGGIHAREWISPATVTYIINEFLTSTDPAVRTVAENIVWHLFPVVNPDGYSYTFSDVSGGASDDPCSNTYAGPAEFSEPESSAIRRYVTTIQARGRMVYYFAFHSFSQLVLVPYSHVGGWDVLQAPNYADMYEIAVRGMDKLQELYGTQYTVGTSKDVLYIVSGSSFDWVRGVADVPIVYLFELRDEGKYGFLLPADQIIPNSKEIVAGLVEMEKTTRGLRYYRNSVEKVLYSFVLLIFGLAITM